MPLQFVFAVLLSMTMMMPSILAITVSNLPGTLSVLNTYQQPSANGNMVTTLYVNGQSALSNNWYSTIPYFQGAMMSIPGITNCIGVIDPNNNPVYAVCPQTNFMGACYSGSKYQIGLTSTSVIGLILGASGATNWGWSALASAGTNPQKLIIDMDGMIKVGSGSGTWTPLHQLTGWPASTTVNAYYKLNEFVFSNANLLGTPVVRSTSVQSNPAIVTSLVDTFSSTSVQPTLPASSSNAYSYQHSFTQTDTFALSAQPIFSPGSPFPGVSLSLSFSWSRTFPPQTSQSWDTVSSSSSASGTLTFWEDAWAPVLATRSILSYLNTTITTTIYTPAASSLSLTEYVSGITIVSPLQAPLMQTRTQQVTQYLVN